MKFGTDEKQPLIATAHPMGGGVLTFAACREKIMKANLFHKGEKADELRQAIRILPDEVREEVIKDFCRYGKSKALANGNRTVFTFFCEVLRAYAEDTGIPLLELSNKYPAESQGQGKF